MARGENSNAAGFGYFGKDLSIKILFTAFKGHSKYLTSRNFLICETAFAILPPLKA
jgi:hypothetical protein